MHVGKQLTNPMHKSAFHLGLEKLIRFTFPNNKMFRVESERHKYRANMVESVYKQVNDMEAEICEVYFDNKYLCDVKASHRPDEALALIQFSLLHKLK